jgi:hypothetical protein
MPISDQPGGSGDMTRPSAECALLAGAPECRCTRDAAGLTEEQIVTRALTKMRFEQRADPAGKAAARRGLDAMLDQARGRGPSTLVSELLRMGIMIRLLGEDEADADEVEAALPGLAGGMRPKLQACIDAIHGGVGYAHIVDGRKPHSLLLELFTDAGIGTKVRPAR